MKSNDARDKLKQIIANRKKQSDNGKGLKSLDIRQMAVVDLVASDYNPRIMDEATLDGLQSSIERFGLVEPIVWNERSNRIVGGHQRLKILQRRGDETTDVAVVDLDEVDERTLNLSLNNPHLQGTFDQEKLEILMKDLEQSLPKLDFGELRLDELHGEFVFTDLTVDGNKTGYISPKDDPDETPGCLLDLVDITLGEPVTKTKQYDVWQLGLHIVICAPVVGDASAWSSYLDGIREFVPYPGPYVLMSRRAQKTPLLLVQPNAYIMGHIIDRFKKEKVGEVCTQIQTGNVSVEADDDEED